LNGKLKINSDLEETQDKGPMANNNSSTRRSGQRLRQSGELSIKKATTYTHNPLLVGSINLESLNNNESDAMISQPNLTNRIQDNQFCAE